MNREKKRIEYSNGYYRNHPCQESFVCKNCGWTVSPADAGTQHRNHCNNCLHSLHLDIEPGDREADCGGLMEPVAVWVSRILDRPVRVGDVIRHGNAEFYVRKIRRGQAWEFNLKRMKE